MSARPYEISRGCLSQKVYGHDKLYGEDGNFLSVTEPIKELMGRVDGAELISKDQILGDEYKVKYLVSPENVYVDFDAGICVRVAISGSTEESRLQVGQRIFSALEQEANITPKII